MLCWIQFDILLTDFRVIAQSYIQAFCIDTKLLVRVLNHYLCYIAFTSIKGSAEKREWGRKEHNPYLLNIPENKVN